ncbi:hypothetical protein QAD02_017929 [Eretmocerus hayati]|uniref:Uncharacterized protein n=1 Tax=Eretmocerus hayati TaxID=131215 RepID=A0ACC2PI91_9HYME|nr:hypothetical protein QAD02_017929 [Eretmocerus hayati]
MKRNTKKVRKKKTKRTPRRGRAKKKRRGKQKSGPSDLRPPKRDDGPTRYIIYCIVNSAFFMNKGNLAAAVARGLLGLYNKMDRDRLKSKALDAWEDQGERLMVLKGLDHKHLCFLMDELHYCATGYYALYQSWSKSKVMLVLSTLGREEDLDEPLHGLSQLK